jgi:large exoprotein involved in heme utilization and adhesion
VYLLNPSGVLFGPNARLDVQGSFHVSTADFLRFADGALFHADPAQPSVLSVAPPAAFGFVRQPLAAITIQGCSLHVSTGKTLSVVGGDIEIIGNGVFPPESPTLSAPSGQINLVSVAVPGEVMVNPAEQRRVLNAECTGGSGVMTISNVARVDVSGDSGGTVTIRGGHLLVDSSDIFANTLGDMDSAEIGIDIEVKTLTLKFGAISSDTEGAEAGGMVTVRATEAVTIEIGIIASSSIGRGKAGDIFLSAPTMHMVGIAGGPIALISTATEGGGPQAISCLRLGV